MKTLLLPAPPKTAIGIDEFDLLVEHLADTIEEYLDEFEAHEIAARTASWVLETQKRKAVK